MALEIHPWKRPGCCSVLLLNSAVTSELHLGPLSLKISSPFLLSYKTPTPPQLIQSGVLAIIVLLFSGAICILKENGQRG